MVDLNELKDDDIIQYLQEIPSFNRWKKITFIDKGWSGEKKYKVESADGVFLLRISSKPSDMCSYATKYEFLLKVKTKSARTPVPHLFGELSNGRNYLLLSWIKGKTLRAFIKRSDDKTKYEIGYKIGIFLSELHNIKKETSIDAPHLLKDDIEGIVRNFKSEKLYLKNEEIVTNFIKKNMHLLNNCTIIGLCHGDLHPDNIIVNKKGRIGIIDWSNAHIGPINNDFRQFKLNLDLGGHFASGIINGYFKDQIPKEFFTLLAVNAARFLVHRILWTKNNQDYKLNLERDVSDVFTYFDNFDIQNPSWYIKDIE